MLCCCSRANKFEPHASINSSKTYKHTCRLRDKTMQTKTEHFIVQLTTLKNYLISKHTERKKLNITLV